MMKENINHPPSTEQISKNESEDENAPISSDNKSISEEALVADEPFDCKQEEVNQEISPEPIISEVRAPTPEDPSALLLDSDSDDENESRQSRAQVKRIVMMHARG